jgi:DNA-binding response OmpR family regulator
MFSTFAFRESKDGGRYSVAKILVIDDEENLRRVVRSILEEDGYEVLEAANGLSGLELYRQHKADLIITDLAMPVMNGLDFISEVTRTFSNVRIIAMTGVPEWDSRLTEAKLLGARETLHKPFTLEMLLNVVRSELTH